ncbi:Carbonic anhydrase, beta class [Citrifermentans bremense]|uniref:carbonic anhydrase n=1 Tax=Citrifermentans bremense TaxID=60035 RepID=A0A6S6M8V3_9BACT|nr:carbonic anhydrase [Citrifermentans bremense]BCG48276.1 Carbonic anhydrase, beta class [Citrifermentans bremense]
MKSSKLAGRIAALATALAATAGIAFASGAAAGVSADEALQKLIDGNNRYVESKMKSSALCDATARGKLAKGQQPYAIILSCSDSRVPPEIVFDQALGEVFVIRVAGNVADPLVLGSVEYAAEHLHPPLVMVLGHERCGAVTATVGAKGKAEGNIGAIVKAIEPAAKKAKAKYKGKSKEEIIECAAEINAKDVAADLTRKSKVVAHMVKEGKLKIVSAKYDLDDGKVTILK